MNWDIKEIHNYNEYMQKYSIHSLLAKIFAQREYNEQDVQGHTSKRLIYHDFSLFLDADLVLDRIQEALENDEKICIYGDYDCDGILSTAILVQAFFCSFFLLVVHAPKPQKYHPKSGQGETFFHHFLYQYQYFF